MAVGHVPLRHHRQRNSAATPSPFVVNHIKGRMALAHNGNLTNSHELRQELELDGAIFHTTSDTEVIAYIITQERLTARPPSRRRSAAAMDQLKGAYSLVIMIPQQAHRRPGPPRLPPAVHRHA